MFLFGGPVLTYSQYVSYLRFFTRPCPRALQRPEPLHSCSKTNRFSQATGNPASARPRLRPLPGHQRSRRQTRLRPEQRHELAGMPESEQYQQNGVQGVPRVHKGVSLNGKVFD
jgi:hypothetical protein